MVSASLVLWRQAFSVCRRGYAAQTCQFGARDTSAVPVERLERANLPKAARSCRTALPGVPVADGAEMAGPRRSSTYGYAVVRITLDKPFVGHDQNPEAT